MDKIYKTQCPYCSTQFKLGQQHLDQAGGMVRCGSCLKPFQAKEHLVEQPSADIPKVTVAPAPAAQKPSSAPSQPAPLTQKKPSSADTLGSPEELLSTANKWQLPDEGLPESQAEDTFDGSLSLGMELELSDELDTPFADDLGGLDASLSNGLEGKDDNAGIDTDESWAEDLLKEVEQETVITPAQVQHKPAQKQAVVEATSQDSMPSVPVSLFDFDESDMGSFSSRRPIKKEPPQPKEPTNLWKWGGLSVLMLALLGIQYFIFNFQDLSRQETYRPFYQQACQVLPCQVPDIIDLNRLRVTNLYIRNVPDEPGTLMVDLILHNEASFAQPFPDLQLVFSNQQAGHLAEGIFSANHYLNGNLKNLKSLPANSRTQLSFRITDPGEDARDFVIKLLAPDHA